MPLLLITQSKRYRTAAAWLTVTSGALDDHVFFSRLDGVTHINTRQYERLVDERVAGIGLRSEYGGTRSLRRTKVSLIYKRTGNLDDNQILLSHTQSESTVRYLGVDVKDALSLAERTEI